jgi:SAM-dependent methyltransferase
VSDLAKYRQSEQEKARTADLLRILPKGRRSVLDIGARDGFFSRLLTESFSEVTALDLERPGFDFPNVTTVAGDVTKLDFGDSSFDCVFCAEVLEHLPDLLKACTEIRRVARHEIIIGVPFRQDTRLGRCSCNVCGKTNPPWGHVNSFDENRLLKLFEGARLLSKSYVGASNAATNSFSAFLMDLGGNPWGSYDQDETCLFCGSRMTPPTSRPLWRKACSSIAIRLDNLQERLTQPHGNWIHVVFSVDGLPAPDGHPRIV